MVKKQIIYGLLVITLITSCKAQKQDLKQDSMKTFDIVTFDKNKVNNVYNFITKDSTVVEQDEDYNEYTEVIRQHKSPFEFQNRYFKSGKIKMEVKRYTNDFMIYLKQYDQQGTLIKETDYDKPYKFTFEDVLKFIKKRNIDMTNYHFEIFRNIVDNKPMWSVTWEKEDESNLQRVIIDGTTGKITKEFDVSYPQPD